TTSNGIIYLITTSNHFPDEILWFPVFIRFNLNSVTPLLITTNAIIAPDSINPSPQTKSWFAKMFKFIADGIPKANPAVQIQNAAFFLDTPISTNIFDDNSTIDINELNAAKVNP